MHHNEPLRLFPEESETIEGVGRALREGRTTCAAVLERCFHQIDLWDARVNAWVFVDRAGAMRQARALDDELKSGACRGPLHGIPFGIKDIIDVAGMPTACGFPPWRDRVADRDAEVVRVLRECGAVILGKTVTTQFAWVDPPPTRNPWNLERTPGGSSSGSAAAVACGMCLGAVGSQTGGSVIRPAAFCGVAGFKPRYGMLSVEGVRPLAPTLDHVGPIGRSLFDVHLVYQVLRCHPYLYRPHGHVEPMGVSPPEHYSEWVEGQRGEHRLDVPPDLLRPRGFFDRRAEPDMLAAFEAALGVLAEAGAKITDLHEDAIPFEAILTDHRTVMSAEAAATHEANFAEHRADYAPHIRALVDEGLATPLTRYVRAQLAWRDADHDAVLTDHPGAAEGKLIVTPATLGPAPDAGTTGNPSFNAPWSFLGWPTWTAPMGLSPDGLPLGLQMTGWPGNPPVAGALWCEDVLRRRFGPERA